MKTKDVMGMKVIPFDKLYSTEFIITEPMAKPQYWAVRGNFYSAIGKPKVSHTLLWFKHCGATITDNKGNTLEVARNQLTYMAKGLEYSVRFHDTDPARPDTVVIHFQMTDRDGEEIAPILKPIIGLKSVDAAMALDIDLLAEEYGKNVVCIPKMQAVIYDILAAICQKQKKRTARNKFAVIRTGIDLLEQDSDRSVAEIAAECGVSECYFRRLFQEYSGESPMAFRQRHRIERAKQLLLSDEQYTIGEVARELGFSDIYHFSKTFKNVCGVSPSKFIEKEQG